MARSRRRTCVGGKFVGRSETTCRTVALAGGTVAETGGRFESTVGATHRASFKKRTVSTMPSSAEDLASRIEDRQRELQDIRFGPRNAVLETSLMIADAGERMHTMTIDDPMS